MLWAYDQFISGAQEKEIADQLNANAILNHFGRPWSRGTIRELLTNEKYIGNNLFNRTSGKMKSKPQTNPECDWIRKEQAFVPLVDAERFYTVQGMYKERNKRISNDELLQGLQELAAREGRLSALIIDESDSLPPSSLFRTRFGGLLRAYRLIGYTPDRDYRYVAINQQLRTIHAKVVSDVIERIERLCGRKIPVDPETSLLELNYNLLISIVITRCLTTQSGNRRWKIRFDTGLRPDITIAVRMDTQNDSINDFYILPALEFSDNNMSILENNTGFIDSFRTDTLDYVLGLGINIPLDKAVENGTRGNHAHPY